MTQEWISVKDRLPEKGDEYNVFWKPDAEEGVVTTMEYDANEKKFIDTAGFCDSDETDSVTHWIPLPGPPNQTKP